MHPVLVQALMAERIRTAHADAAVGRLRDRGRRRTRPLSRDPRPRSAWTTKTA